MRRIELSTLLTKQFKWADGDYVAMCRYDGIHYFSFVFADGTLEYNIVDFYDPSIGTTPQYRHTTASDSWNVVERRDLNDSEINALLLKYDVISIDQLIFNFKLTNLTV